MQLKYIAAAVLAVGVAFGLGVGLFNQQDTAPAADTAALDSDAYRVAEGEPARVAPAPVPEVPQQAPNFDTRDIVNAVKKPDVEPMSVEMAEQVIANKQAKMQLLIEEYNSSLDNPEQRAALERKFKIHSEEYKKAVLVKVKSGEQ